MFSRRTKGRSAAGLTPTQIIILQHAKAGPVHMMRGDRRGTRCTGYEDASGAARIIAYGSPEFFLVRRGFLRPCNHLHYYEITAAGREIIAKAEKGLAPSLNRIRAIFS